MATCPRCKGHLTDSHKCPRRRTIVAAEIAASALAGGFAGLLLLAVFDPREQITGVESILVVGAGALVCIGITRAARG
jgi:peptidoglycan/LPS O-acetylase OafA/YrhL